MILYVLRVIEGNLVNKLILFNNNNNKKLRVFGFEKSLKFLLYSYRILCVCKVKFRFKLMKIIFKYFFILGLIMYNVFILFCWIIKFYLGYMRIIF